MMMAELIFFGGLLLVAYVYIGYPLLLWLLGAFKCLKTRAAAITPVSSVIIAVHNEDAVIANKLDNTLALDYPRERLEILVASDGSTDETEEIVAHYAPLGVRLLRLPRCGKMRALEHAVTHARGEILVFTDANTWILSHALRALVTHFADPEVGGVCGRKRIGRAIAGEAVAQSEGIYWKYDQLLKKWESRIGSTIAADGALYAIRCDLFQPPTDPAQADDMAVSVQIPIQGKRLVFEPEAVVWEDPPGSPENEFWRKVRVTNHVIRSLWASRASLNPLRTGFFAVQICSHKLLRYLVPFPLAVAWIANFYLASGSIFYSLLLGAQSMFYFLAVAGLALRHHTLGRSSFLHAPFYFCLAHSAALLGLLSAMRGKRIVTWNHQRTAPSLRVNR